MRYTQARRGFTLLEILLATGIFMIIMVVGVAIFASTVGNASSSEQSRVNAQAARFAFESIIREARLAKGLVYTDTSDANSSGAVKMLVPPFDFNDRNQPTRVNIYQVKKVGINTDGDSTYSIDRRSYFISGNKIVLETSSAYTGNNAKSSKELYKIAVTDELAAARTPSIQAFDWGPVSQVQVLPSDRATNQFNIIHWANYPTPDVTIDTTTLPVQPFFEVQTTVFSPNYNASREERNQVRTTLRTTIVPRNFVSPFEVVQSGIQGAAN
jgi:type II secretory pathway pseudopilin PulG